jgi:hypothetical protein
MTKTTTSPKITVFSAPKAFTGHIGVIQENAVRSWLALGDRVEVILLGDEPGVAEIAHRLGVRHIANLATNEYGTPLLDALLGMAEAAATAPYLCMINGDIILTSDFIRFVDKLERLPRALYLGLRSDLDVKERLDFTSPDWEQTILQALHRYGRFRGQGDDSFNGTDYYIFPRGLYAQVPPFAIGRFFWDSWLIASVIRRGHPVINTSSEILAIHQNHDYGHVKSAAVVDMYRFWLNPELERNYRLAGGFLDLMGPREAPFRLEGDEVVRIPGKSLWRSRLYNIWYYYPIWLRSQPFFRSPWTAKLWNELFPFHAPSGRHRFDRHGIPFLAAGVRGAVRNVLRRMRGRSRGSPEQDRASSNQAGRRTSRPWLAERRGGAPRPAGQRHLLPIRRWLLRRRSPARNRSEPVPERLAGIRSWMADHCREGTRLIVPAELQAFDERAFSYGFFQARAEWRDMDLDFEVAVISRKELDRVPVEALRCMVASLSQVYRDADFMVLSRARLRPQLKSAMWPELRERLTMNGGAGTGDVTAILNVWKRGPDLLRRQIDALLEQTAPPAEIWVCAFGVADCDTYRRVVEEYRLPNLHFMSSTRNLKYHGRFQLALTAATAYVAVIDDDIVIGRDFLRRCRETMEHVADAGDVGVYGWRKLPGPDRDGVLDHYTRGEFIEHFPPQRKDMGLVPVDLLCGYHFLRTESVRYLFRDRAWTLASGEDFQLAFALRKYGNLSSYIVPIEPDNPDTWGMSSDWLEIREHATTVGDMDAIRDALYWRLLNRGHPVHWMSEGTECGACRAFAIYSTAADARVIGKYLRRYPEIEAEGSVLAIYCGIDREDAIQAAEALGLPVSDQARHRLSWLDLEMGRSGAGSADVQLNSSELVYALNALVRAMSPSRLLIVAQNDPVLASVARVVCHGRDTAIVEVCPGDGTAAAEMEVAGQAARA